MTERQKTQIRILRERGTGYGAIAKELEIPRETVKSFCRRSGVSVREDCSESTENSLSEPEIPAAAPDSSSCRACGNPIEQKPGRKRRVFCCAECRSEWWRQNPGRIHRKALYPFVCAGCGKAFTAYGNQRRKYCSHACYIRARFGGEKPDGEDG